MPSAIGHAVLGGATGWALPRPPLPKGVILAGAVCSALPDIDAIGFRLGVAYGDWLGHRGFSHSLAFAVLVGAAFAAAWPAAPRGRASRLAIFAFLTACTASHGVLDAMTDGGLGVAFFSPFSNQRYFFPWRPIVVSPISPRRLLSAWGLRVLVSETICIGVPVALVVLTRLGWQRFHRARA